MYMNPEISNHNGPNPPTMDEQTGQKLSQKTSQWCHVWSWDRCPKHASPPARSILTCGP